MGCCGGWLAVVLLEIYEVEKPDHTIYDRHVRVNGWVQEKLSGGRGSIDYPGTNMVIVGSGRIADFAAIYSICVGSKRVVRLVTEGPEEETFCKREGPDFSDLVREVSHYNLVLKKEQNLTDAVKKAVEGDHDRYIMLADCEPNVSEKVVWAAENKQRFFVEAHSSKFHSSLYINPKEFHSRMDRGRLSVGADSVAASFMVDTAVYDAIFEKEFYSPLLYYGDVGVRIAKEESDFHPPETKGVGNKNVTLVGVGGVGHWIALMMTIAGVPIKLIDGDTIEVVNFVKQPFFGNKNGKKKVEVMREMVQRYLGTEIGVVSEFLYGENGVEVERHKKNRVENNVERLLEGSSLIISSVDRHVIRRDMEIYATERGIPVIDGGLSVDQAGISCKDQPYGSHVLPNALLASIIVDSAIKYISSGKYPPKKTRFYNCEYVKQVVGGLTTPNISIETRSFIPERGDKDISSEIRETTEEIINNMRRCVS